jgi:putative transposase
MASDGRKPHEEEPVFGRADGEDPARSKSEPSRRGREAPRYLRSDNGPEFIVRAILAWLTEAETETVLIDPRKPWQNGSNESFDSKFRDECLGLHWINDRVDAKILIEAWRREYNEVRPHSSLGQLTPAEFGGQIESTQQRKAVF